jgi:hypothetical protein
MDWNLVMTLYLGMLKKIRPHEGDVALLLLALTMVVGMCAIIGTFAYIADKCERKDHGPF